MNSSAPQIGFDRFIQLDWVAVAIHVRAGKSNLDELHALLAASVLGKEAKAKTLTKLNALCLEPRTKLSDFIGRGAIHFSGAGARDDIAPFAWGAAIATYSYFGKVAEFTGRLTSIQGDCSTAEIHRRMSEVYGDREITKRATQAAIQTQANWGAVERLAKGKRVIRLAPKIINNDALTAWLIEAAVRYIGKPVSVPTLQSLPVLFPFTLTRPLAYVISNSPNLDLRSEGPSSQFVALRTTI